MADMRGKTVLVTGAASGIGFCTAQEFLKAGAELVITDINQEGLDEAVNKLRARGGVVAGRRVDVSDRAAVNDLARWVIEEKGGLDVLINNAGIGHSAELAKTSLETWERLMAVNFWGPLYHVYAFLPHMIERRRGHIVNVSSGQAFFRLPAWGAYATSKVAVGAFSEMLGVEVRKYGIRVTTVYPFMVDTPFYRGIEGDTWLARLSMRLVPYYSMSPERVARIVFKAVKRGKAVEKVSVLNDVGYYAHLVPPLAGLIGRVTNLVLTEHE